MPRFATKHKTVQFKMHLTNDERIFLVERYIETNDYNVVRTKFIVRFPNRNVPSKSTIVRNVNKFQRHGTIENLNAGRSGRNRTVRTQANVQLV